MVFYTEISESFLCSYNLCYYTISPSPPLPLSVQQTTPTSANSWHSRNHYKLCHISKSPLMQPRKLALTIINLQHCSIHLFDILERIRSAISANHLPKNRFSASTDHRRTRTMRRRRRQRRCWNPKPKHHNKRLDALVNKAQKTLQNCSISIHNRSRSHSRELQKPKVLLHKKFF